MGLVQIGGFVTRCGQMVRCCAGFLLLTSGMFLASAGAQTGGRMKQVGIWDPVLGMVGFTITVPADWVVEGAILRSEICGRRQPEVVFRAQSKDGLYGVQSMPHFISFSSDMPGALAHSRLANCPKPENDLIETVGKIVAMSRGGAVVETAGPADDFFQNAMVQKDQQTRAKFAGFESRVSVGDRAEVKRMRVEYSLNGQDEAEWLELDRFIERVPGFGERMAVGTIQILDTRVVGMRAPKGQLARVEGQLRAIMRSQQPVAGWPQKQQAHQAEEEAMTEQQLNASAARSIAAVNESIRKLQAATVALAQHSEDVRAQTQEENRVRTGQALDWIDVMNGNQFYGDRASGETMTLPDTATKNYISNDGTTIFRTNAEIDERMLYGDWSRLEPLHHY